MYKVTKLMQVQTKAILTSVLILTFAATLITASITSDAFAAKDKKPKTVKCNNVKVNVRVNGVEENQTIVASVTIGASAKTKSGTVDVNETDITLPIHFKKIFECPGIGSTIFGDVNGTGFTSTLTSLKKPNKVVVDLS